MWIASGSYSRMRRATSRPGRIASGISGYVGIGNVRKPWGESTWTSWPQRSSHATVLRSVTTTPFTCGAQASVTRRIRKLTLLVVEDLLLRFVDGLPVDDP